MERTALRVNSRNHYTAVRLISLAIASALGVATCSTPRRHDGEPVQQSERSQVPPEGQSQSPSFVLTKDGLGPVRFCALLDTVNAVFKSVRDTTFVCEDGQCSWPGKIVHISGSPDSGSIIFEASWADRVRLSGVRVTTALVRTRKGYGPGTMLRALIAAGESLSIELPEGALVVDLSPDDIALGVDSASQRDFHQRYAFQGAPTLSMINPQARIVDMATGHTCTKKER